MWFHHLLNLVRASASGFLEAIGTTWLGFVLSLVIAIASIVATLLRIYQKRGREAMLAHWEEDATTALWVTFVCASAIYVPVFAWKIASTIYLDHIRMAAEIHAAQVDNRVLQKDLDYHRNNIKTSDPVFINETYMMTSFRMFREATHGESCVVSFTAPKQTAEMAMAWASFSIQADNCPTFGPITGDRIDPDTEAKIYNGMIPDAIVVHAARGDKAADALMGYLGNEIKLIRSYELGTPQYVVPAGGYKHALWLQFGTNVKWNGERN